MFKNFYTSHDGLGVFTLGWQNKQGKERAIHLLIRESVDAYCGYQLLPNPCCKKHADVRTFGFWWLGMVAWEV